MEESYGSMEQTEVVDQVEENAEETVKIVVAEDKPNKPTLGPIGRQMKRNAQIQYNPYDWVGTLFLLRDGSYVSRSFYVVGIIGTVLVIVSGIAGIGLDKDDRQCRAWCSRFALGTQPHSYMGFILSLLITFRTREAYKMYQAGLSAHYKGKELLRRFVDAILFKVPRDAIPEEKRARMVAYCVSIPYAFTADMRQERRYDDGAIDQVLSTKDYEELISASSMPLYLIENIVVMVRKYCDNKCPAFALKRMYISIEGLYAAYGTMEKIKQSPCAFAYVAHLRFLLITYLTTLPLALVEQMGFSTIPVFWVICYALMSLEMMAVEVENPYGYGTSDLRMHEYNLLVKESLLESWKRWKYNLDVPVMDKDRLNDYKDFNSTGQSTDYSDSNEPFFNYW